MTLLPRIPLLRAFGCATVGRELREVVSRMAEQEEPVRGAFANGMEFLTWGTGRRTLLFLGGGPGSGLPQGISGRMSRRWFDPFVDAGYTVWYVTRRRHLPPGHSVADMADDCAAAISERLSGRADLVVGESYGGMIAQHLAAGHGDHVGRVALVAAAARVSDWGKEVDARLVAALVRDDRRAFGAAFAEYVLPDPRAHWLRQLVGPLVVRSILSGTDYPRSDLRVELEAEMEFDARSALPQIRVPVVLLCGEQDLFFPPDIVDETVRLIPGCTHVGYAGQGHVKVASSRRVPHDVLAFVDQG